MKNLIYTINTDYTLPITESAIIALMSFVAFLLILAVKEIYKTKEKKGLFRAILALVFSIFMVISSINGIVYDYKRFNDLKKSFKNKEYKVAKGTIRNFNPIKFGLKGVESFEVNGTKFAFSPAYDTGGFTKVGILKAGDNVKIFYIKNKETIKCKSCKVKYIMLQVERKNNVIPNKR